MNEAFWAKEPPYESMHTSLVEINRILNQRDALAHLCGEMLATLRLDSNQEHTISKLNELCLAGWRKVYKENSGDPSDTDGAN